MGFNKLSLFILGTPLAHVAHTNGSRRSHLWLTSLTPLAHVTLTTGSRRAHHQLTYWFTLLILLTHIAHTILWLTSLAHFTHTTGSHHWLSLLTPLVRVADIIHWLAPWVHAPAATGSRLLFTSSDRWLTSLSLQINQVDVEVSQLYSSINK